MARHTKVMFAEHMRDWGRSLSADSYMPHPELDDDILSVIIVQLAAHGDLKSLAKCMRVSKQFLRCAMQDTVWRVATEVLFAANQRVKEALSAVGAETDWYRLLFDLKAVMRTFFDVSIGGKPAGRIVFQVRVDFVFCVVHFVLMSQSTVAKRVSLFLFLSVSVYVY